MSGIKWYRVYHGMPDDQKLAMLAEKACVRRCEMLAVWCSLLDHASQHVERGYVGDIDPDVLAYAQEIDRDKVLSIFDTLKEKGVIVDGRLAAWEKRQPRREETDDKTAENNATLRKRRQRERDKKAHDVTQCHAMSRNVTQCHAQDRDRDIDKDISIPSLRSGIDARTRASDFDLPDWIPKDAWKAYVEMRREIRKPMTQNAMQMAVNKLDNLRKKGHAPPDVLKQSVFYTWVGLFEIKGQNNAGHTHHYGNPAAITGDRWPAQQGKPTWRSEGERLAARYLAAGDSPDKPPQ